MIYRSARATGLGALALALAVVTAGCGAPEPAAPATAPVSRATVATSVSATGSLSSTDKANVGFTRGGQLVAVNVKVGDTVQAGQVLARIDPFPAQQSLRTAQTQFDGQQASFNRVVNGTSVDGAENSVDQARRILAATQKQVSAQNAANSRAVDDAERAYDKAKAGAAKAQAAFQQQTQLCTQAQMAAMTPTQPAPGTQMQMSAASANPVPCILLPGAQSAAQMAQQGVQQALATLQQAQNTKKTGEASGRVSIENARNGVVMAQNQLDSSQTDRPSNVDQARAALDGARVGLDNARRDLANTTLRAPIAGKVAALNGAVGEFVNQSSTVTPFAGGSASIPGAATDAGAAGAAGGQSGGASPSRPGGNQFIVLQNPSGFSAVAPFQEVDAVKVQPGQRAEVSVDALPDSTLSGTVLTVSPLSSDISSVINYYVTVAVDRPDPRLRDGQTTRASVITGEGKNALSVPNAAVTKQGDRNSVVVVGPDGRQTPVPFTPGIVGSDRTEVLNGLDEGQQVLLTGNR